MDSRIENLSSTTFCGKRLTRKQIAAIQQTVNTFPALSRRELALTISEHLNWVTEKGDARIGLCLKVLQQLEKQGVFQLPAKIEKRSAPRKAKPIWSARTAPAAEIAEPLVALLPLTLEVVTDAELVSEWNEWLDRYHYLGYRHPMGAHVRYFIVDGYGRKLGCVLFQQAVTRLGCRDDWIGWHNQAHKKQLHLVLNNSRFLILPWVKVKNLASKVLSQVVVQLPRDWQRVHGYRPVLIETFVDQERFSASSYRAANWHYLGTTKKRSGKTLKGVYVYELSDQARSILVQGERAVKVKMRTQKRPSAPPLSSDDGFVQLWRNVIELISEVAVEYDEKWRVRRRVIGTLLVMLFVFRLVFSQNRQGYKTTLWELWQQCRDLGVTLPQPQPVSDAAMVKARRKLDERVFKVLQQRILQRYEAEQQDFLWQGRRLYAVDGSKLNLPTALLQNGYRRPNDKAHYPQGLLSCLYRLQARIPIDFELAAHLNERMLALEHLKKLNSGDVVVYDRGYYSYELLHEHWLRGVDGIFRMQRNSAKVIDEFMQSDNIEQQVEVNASWKSRRKILARHAQAHCPALPLRCVKYTIGTHSYTLATSLVDAKKFPIEVLSAVYHRRWGVEEMYKTTKSQLEIEQFHAKSERGVKQELYAHFVLITLTRIFTNFSEHGLQSPALGAVVADEPVMRVNFKNSLRVFARHFEELVLVHSQWLTKTLQTMLDSIGSCYQKERPQRSYPRVSKQPRNKWHRAKKTVSESR